MEMVSVTRKLVWGKSKVTEGGVSKRPSEFIEQL